MKGSFIQIHIAVDITLPIPNFLLYVTLDVGVLCCATKESRAARLR